MFRRPPSSTLFPSTTLFRSTAASPTGTSSVTATNGVAVTGSGASFTAQSDSTLPTGGAFSANGQSANATAALHTHTALTTLLLHRHNDYAETQSRTESGLAS